MPENGVQQQPLIFVFGVGGAGGNAVDNMIEARLRGVEFIVANTDAQALAKSKAQKRLQLGSQLTKGLGAGARPDVGRASAEEELEEIRGHLQGCNMVFITAGMGGGTGTGAAPVIARAAKEAGILTVGVVTKPFKFEGAHRMRSAESGIAELQQYVDTLIVIPNQNLFRVANEKTTFAEAFRMADDVLHAGVRGVTDLMMMPGLINLDFADVRTVMSEMGKAMMGTGEAAGERRALQAAEAAISNPLLDDVSLKGARAALVNITGGMDIALFEVDEAVNRIRDEMDPDANIIFGSTFDQSMNGTMRVSVVATGIEVHPARNESQARTAAGALAGIDLSRKLPGVAPVMAQARGTAAAEYLGRLVASPLHASAIPAPSAARPAAVPEMAAQAEQPALAAGNFFAEPENQDDMLLPPLFSGTGLHENPEPAVPGPARKPEAVAERPARPSLFARMTGLGASARRSAEDPADLPPQVPQKPLVARAADGPGDLLAEKTRLVPVDDDVLDIPAFLRRQVN
ncbi:MAG: cell division protein FtsZ [Pseudomonadota bacterium]|nr:cell division protein FtsZ [Pseudomonadota bacterium]